LKRQVGKELIENSPISSHTQTSEVIREPELYGDGLTPIFAPCEKSTQERKQRTTAVTAEHNHVCVEVESMNSVRKLRNGSASPTKVRRALFPAVDELCQAYMKEEGPTKKSI
jgi:hypothetical protein